MDLRHRITERKFRCAGRASPAPWLSLWESWHGAAVTERVPSGSQYARFLLNFRLPPAAEPGDPLRCGSTAWVTGSPLPAGAARPSQSRFARQLPHRGSQGRLRRRAIDHTFPNRVTPNGVGLLPGSQARHSQRVQPALSVTACAVPALPKGEPRAAAPPSHLPYISEPGDPQRCGSTARVAGSS